MASVGIMGRRMTRGMAGIGAALLALMLTTACVPEPAPSPTPTGFASEEEAFAAAEATYRAYVDAVNARRENPDSSPDPTNFLTGSAYNEELETDQLLEERGWHLAGETEVLSATGSHATAHEVAMTVCLDASATRVMDSSGSDVTPADRADVLGVDVIFKLIEMRLMIAESSTSAEQC